jgi:DNA-binding NarL/FixJ family response regulator
MGSQLLAEALRRERRFRIKGCAATCNDLLAFLPEAAEVIVLAVNFEKPGGGLETAARIAAQGCPAAVLMLLDHVEDQELIVQAFRAGARGVFSRSQSLPEMCKCMECLARGEIWASGEQVGYVLEALKRSVVPRFVNAEGTEQLSPREQDIVRYLCDGLTNRDIAMALGLSEHTVKNHLFRIYAKLGVDKRVEVMFSVLSRPAGAKSLELTSRPATGKDPQRLEWYLQCSERSLMAQYMLGKMCQDGCGTDQDPLAAYTWLLRSEKGATELIGKCREIRELLGECLTAEQRKQAEFCAGRQHPRQSSVSPLAPSFKSLLALVAEPELAATLSSPSLSGDKSQH